MNIPENIIAKLYRLCGYARGDIDAALNSHEVGTVEDWLDSQPTAAEFDKRLLHLLDINLEAQQRIAELEDELDSQPVAPEPTYTMTELEKKELEALRTENSGMHSMIQRLLDEQARQPVAPEPDWSQAPKWAQWACVLPSNERMFSDVEPVEIFGRWSHAYDQLATVKTWIIPCNLPLGIDWRTTLTLRPEGK